ncbi:MAG: hypothetical protein RIQ59_688 [Bacteroidota bacterium]|jgi:hypothetical protein
MYLLNQLTEKSAAKRKIAAKNLRKQIVKNAGVFLLEALKKEVLDKRNWEVQYQLIMAIAQNNYYHALPFLKTLINADIETMTKIGLGDAISRLEYQYEDVLTTLPWAIENKESSIVQGGIRSLALMHSITISENLILKIIDFANKPENTDLIFWTCAASAGWRNEKAYDFLEKCLKDNSSPDETKKAASAALKGKFLKWNIL